MKTKLELTFAALVAGLGLLALTAPSRPAGAQVPAASSSSSASSKPPPPPPLRGSDIPAEASKPPKAAEWKSGRPVSIEGLSCDAKLLREYLRVSCGGLIGVGLVAGEPKDVRAWVSGVFGYDITTSTQGTTTAMIDLPLRRGQSYLVSFNDVGGGDYVATWGDGGHLIVSWREGDADPLIVQVLRFD